MPGSAGRCASPAPADSPTVACNGTLWLARHRRNKRYHDTVRPKFGMQFSPHDHCQALNHPLRLILQFAPEPSVGGCKREVERRSHELANPVRRLAEKVLRRPGEPFVASARRSPQAQSRRREAPDKWRHREVPAGRLFIAVRGRQEAAFKKWAADELE